MTSMPPIRLAPVVTLPSREALDLERELLELAARARRGEVTGLAYSALMRDGSTQEAALGRARSDITRAHYGVSRLADRLLWPDND